jgi:hypothetical protein
VRSGVIPRAARVRRHLAVEVGGVQRLTVQVELLAGGAGELLDQAGHVEAAEHGKQVDQPGRQPQEGQVDARPLGDPRLEDLHDDVVAVREHGPVHLRQGRRCDRSLLEHDEHVVMRSPELTVDHLGDRGRGNRRQRVEELAELLGVVGSQQVVPGCEQLSELHVAATAGLEVPTQDTGPRGRAEGVAQQEGRSREQAQDDEPGESSDREGHERDPVAHGRSWGSPIGEAGACCVAAR